MNFFTFLKKKKCRPDGTGMIVERERESGNKPQSNLFFLGSLILKYCALPLQFELQSNLLYSFQCVNYNYVNHEIVAGKLN